MHTKSYETIIESLSEQQQNASVAHHSGSTNQGNPITSYFVSVSNASKKKVLLLKMNVFIDEPILANDIFKL